MKTIRYQKLVKMPPREGVKYATTYVKQTIEQRQELVRHVQQVIKEIAEAIEYNQELCDFLQKPLQGFKTSTGQNRSITDILADMVQEAQGQQRNGLPKDFALAPIERWNRLFRDTDYAMTLVQTFGPRANNFSKIMEFNDVEQD